MTEANRVVDLLVTGAIERTRRPELATVEHADRRSPALADRVWVVVLDHMGGPTWLRDLVDAVRRGPVSTEQRNQARRAVEDAMDQDQRFAGAIREALREHTTQTAHASDEANVLQAGRDITQTIVNHAKANPLMYIVAAGVLVILLIAGVYLAGNTSRSTATGVVTPPNPDVTDVQTGLASTPTRTDTGSAGGIRNPELIRGSWTTAGSENTKMFTENGGPCEGFFYSQGRPLDIGGPMSCTISREPDAQNRYTLQVTQSPNRASYKIAFTSENHAVVYDNADTALYELSRF